MKVNSFLALLLVIVFLEGCLDDSIRNINDSVYFNPSYSLPLAYGSLTMEDVANSMGLWEIDTTGLADSVGYFWYDSTFYGDTAGFFDTTIFYNIDFSTIFENQENIKTLMFRLNTSNGFPTKTFVQVYFINENDITIDSLFDQGALTLNAAQINSECIVTEESILHNFDTYLDEQEIDMIPLVRRIALYEKIETSRQDIDFVRFFPEYKIDFHLALRAELELTLGAK